MASAVVAAANDSVQPVGTPSTAGLEHTTAMSSFNLSNTTDYYDNPLCELNEYCEPLDMYVDRLYADIFPDPGKWVLIFIYIMSFCVGLVGNCLVCFAIWRNRNMRTVTNIFIVNLAVADLAVIIGCLPTVLVVDVTFTWFFGEIVCKIVLFLNDLSISVSVLTLTAISVERWYAICHPLRFHSTVRRARAIIIAIWVIATCIALPEFIFASTMPQFNYTVLYTSCYPVLLGESGLKIHTICMIVGLYFVPLLLMALTYTHIAFVLWNGSIPGEQRVQQPMLNRHDPTDQTEARKKAAKMLCAIVVMFALCFFPIHLLNILRYAGVLDHFEGVQIFAMFAHWAACINSCVNPIIYNFMSDKFRKEFKQSVGACLGLNCGRASRSFRHHDPYKVTFTSAPSLSCNMTDSSPTSFLKKPMNGDYSTSCA